MKKLLIGIVMILIMIRCSTPTKSHRTDGEYICNLYNSNDNVYAHGWIFINDKDTNNVNGNWEFNQSALLSSGELAGYKNKGIYYINLHPEMIDNNIFLSFQVENNKLNGNWSYSTFIGVSDQGKLTGYKFLGD